MNPARAAAPRSSHATWEPGPDRVDPVVLLRRQARSRIPELVPLRHARMLASPFAFLRGGAAVMANDLAHTPVTGLRAQLCGDAHLANFGAFAAPDRALVFDVNDFDETLPGPWEWDVKRLAASVAVAGRENGGDYAPAVLGAVRGYREAMREFAQMRTIDVWYSRVDVRELALEAGVANKPTVRKALAKAEGKDSLRAFAKLTHTVDGRPRIISDPPLIVPIEELTADEPALDRLLRGYAATLAPNRRHLLDGYRAVHFARKVVGVGSVGTDAWIVLLLGRDERDPLFLQVKEATKSVLEPFAGRGPHSHGQRVVEGQRLMQAASDILLGWLNGERGIDGRKRDYYVRQLWDAKASVAIEALTPAELAVYAQRCGQTLARAHARSGDRFALADYLGGSDRFDRAIAAFSERYADQNERDYEAMQDAARLGRLPVA